MSTLAVREGYDRPSISGSANSRNKKKDAFAYDRKWDGLGAVEMPLVPKDSVPSHIRRELTLPRYSTGVL